MSYGTPNAAPASSSIFPTSMSSLLVDAESIGYKMGGLMAAQMLLRRADINRVIMGDSTGIELMLRETVFMNVSEMLSNYVMSMWLGQRPVSLLTDFNISMITNIIATAAVQYMIEQTNILERILPDTGSVMQQVALTSAMYIIAQEIVSKIVLPKL